MLPHNGEVITADRIVDARLWLERLVGTRSAEGAINWVTAWLAEDPELRLHELRDEADVATFAGEVALTLGSIDPQTALRLLSAPTGYWAEGVSGGTTIRVHGVSPREALRALRRGLDGDLNLRSS